MGERYGWVREGWARGMGLRGGLGLRHGLEAWGGEGWLGLRPGGEGWLGQNNGKKRDS